MSGGSPKFDCEQLDPGVTCKQERTEGRVRTYVVRDGAGVMIGKASNSPEAWHAARRVLRERVEVQAKEKADARQKVRGAGADA